MKKFETEVMQNRPRMALSELIPILKDMEDRLAKLEASCNCDNCDCGDKPVAKKTASKKKAATKKTAAIKEKESSDEE